jgi:hypothetical protein
MLLSDPETPVAQIVGGLSHLDGLPERGRGGLPRQLRHDVEHRVS